MNYVISKVSGAQLSLLQPLPLGQSPSINVPWSPAPFPTPPYHLNELSSEGCLSDMLSLDNFVLIFTMLLYIPHLGEIILTLTHFTQHDML